MVMEEDRFLEEYLEICRRIYERHVREGTWPWPVDSTNPDDMVDSDHNIDEI